MKTAPLSFALATTLAVSTANADWKFRPQAGVASTDNAYYSADNQTSDVYAWARAAGSYLGEKDVCSFTLTYKGYSKAAVNNSLHFRLSTLFPLAIQDERHWELEIETGGQDYLNENPGTTEQSFDSYYGKASILKTLKLAVDKELVLQPGFEARSYPSFGGRFDADLSARSFLTWEINDSQELEPFFGLGFVISNQDLYSRRYLEFGAEWSHTFVSGLKLGLDFSTTFSSYPNRTVSQTTAVTTKRGRVVSASQVENESQTLTQLSASLARMFEASELKVTTAFTSNSSRSGAVDYSEFNLSGSYTYSF